MHQRVFARPKTTIYARARVKKTYEMHSPPVEPAIHASDRAISTLRRPSNRTPTPDGSNDYVVLGLGGGRSGSGPADQSLDQSINPGTTVSHRWIETHWAQLHSRVPAVLQPLIHIPRCT